MGINMLNKSTSLMVLVVLLTSCAGRGVERGMEALYEEGAGKGVAVSYSVSRNRVINQSMNVFNNYHASVSLKGTGGTRIEAVSHDHPDPAAFNNCPKAETLVGVWFESDGPDRCVVTCLSLSKWSNVERGLTESEFHGDLKRRLELVAGK